MKYYVFKFKADVFFIFFPLIYKKENFAFIESVPVASVSLSKHSSIQLFSTYQNIHFAVIKKSKETKGDFFGKRKKTFSNLTSLSKVRKASISSLFYEKGVYFINIYDQLLCSKIPKVQKRLMTWLFSALSGSALHNQLIKCWWNWALVFISRNILLAGFLY